MPVTVEDAKKALSYNELPGGSGTINSWRRPNDGEYEFTFEYTIEHFIPKGEKEAKPWTKVICHEGDKSYDMSLRKSQLLDLSPEGKILESAKVKVKNGAILLLVDKMVYRKAQA